MVDGIFISRNGEIYEGKFKDGFLYGQGKITRSDGLI
jgi:hypothetical protein